MFVQKPTKESTLVLHRLVVEKHGSHNQSSHGGKGGGKGGGGGGGSSSAPSGDSKENKQAVGNAVKGYEDAKETFEYEVNNLRGETPSDSRTIASARKDIDSAMTDFKQAKSLTGEKQKSKLQSASNKFDNGLTKIDKISVRNDVVQRVMDSIPSDDMQNLGIEGFWDQ